MKYETFPVFDLSPSHPVNRAFIAATADLGNTLGVEPNTGLTCYDKDEGNYELLRSMHEAYCPDRATNPISRFVAPSSMSVNCLTSGFVDKVAITVAAQSEIVRRNARYQDEIVRGIETAATLDHFNQYVAE